MNTIVLEDLHQEKLRHDNEQARISVRAIENIKETLRNRQWNLEVPAGIFGDDESGEERKKENIVRYASLCGPIVSFFLNDRPEAQEIGTANQLLAGNLIKAWYRPRENRPCDELHFVIATTINEEDRLIEAVLDEAQAIVPPTEENLIEIIQAIENQ